MMAKGAKMAKPVRKGAVRYLVLGVVCQTLSKGMEAMGDRAMLEAGPGQGAGLPFYLPALLLTLIAVGLFLFALRRLYHRLTGKDGQAASPAPLPATRTQRIDAPSIDVDAALARYLAKRPPGPPQPPIPARRGSFGKKGGGAG